MPPLPPCSCRAHHAATTTCMRHEPAAAASEAPLCNIWCRRRCAGFHRSDCVVSARCSAETRRCAAQHGLRVHYNGWGVAQDIAEALPWYQLAAAQGHPDALYHVGSFHKDGEGVPANKDEAIRWHSRAQAAGDNLAAATLQELRA
jgi:hypothetical protein